MSFLNIAPDCRIEVFYMNQQKCDNYNAFHRLGHNDDPVTPGYYYEDMVGPFTTKQIAIDQAKTTILA